MSLPDFLIVGAQRSGSTWLHELLQSHPSIYMPHRRKEVQFFNKHYDRGLDWYRDFFPSDAEADAYDAIGEATPTYFSKSVAPERISRDLPDAKLLLILRNPADRAFSHYMLLVQSDGYRGTFEDLLAENRGPFDYGLYGHWLARYLEYFDRSQFCILIYEDAVRQVEESKARLARFLGTDPAAFPPESGYRKANQSYVPKAGRAFSLAKRTARRLQASDIDWPVNLFKGAVKRLLSKPGERPVFNEETRTELLDRYREDIALLGSLFPLDLSSWDVPREVADQDGVISHH